jgi:hypothetical protein
MFLLHQIAKEYGVRPSDLVGISHEYVAFCVDQIVFRWGTYVQGELDSVDGKDKNQIEGRRRAVIHRLLGEKRQRFASPTPTK